MTNYHKEHVHKKQLLIIDIAIVNDEYEVIAMREDGNELDIATFSNKNDAIKCFNQFIAKYPADTKKLSGKYAKLRDDLQTALEAGRQAQKQNPEDGGTCNFDTSMLSLPRWNFEKVQQAVQEAGATCFAQNFYGSKRFFIVPKANGQGNARTASAKAITKMLQSLGYNASMYYAMD
ncbi:hypothetical protein J2S20_002145 [Moryella indoligenes]|uniref:Uncharacterized protein n=1 Tax=Moryella indoligenes TaxID=371674 RepID=A0AAE3VCG0_9FIRM|nr:hypothetical protein [Moryella indoligenes]MDQ0153425.1 hypothetical protein [Moryella indoligenes]